MKHNHLVRLGKIVASVLLVVIPHIILITKVDAQGCGKSFPKGGTQLGAYASGGAAKYVPTNPWCDGNLLLNGNFVDSLVAGTMPVGKAANWTLAYGSPDVNAALGCEDIGFVQMWGNKVVGEAIQQHLQPGSTIIHSHFYHFDICYRWHQPVLTRPYPVAVKVRVSDVPLSGPLDSHGIVVGTTPLTYSKDWISVTLSWFADSDYSYITISPENQSSANDADSTSFCFVDGVCVKDVSPASPNTAVANGWNLISVPVTVEDFRRSTVFPTATSAAFGFQGGYFASDTLRNGKGYWLKFPSGQTIPVNGYEINILTIPVAVGWNLIGSISAPIPVSSIISDPPGIVTSRVFGYEYSNGYTHADTIMPFKGYWIKTSGTGTLILDATLSAETIAKSRIRITSTGELPPPPPDGSKAMEPAIPKEYGLDQAYPNPFNPSTTIQYQLPSDSKVNLHIFNILGQIVQTLVNQTEQAGYKQVEWNASNFASGLYFYRLEATSVANPSKTFTSVKKMLLMK